MTTVAIVNWNSGPGLEACLRSLQEHSQDRNVVVVDNASTDDSAGTAASSPRIKVVRSAQNLGFAGAVNVAFQESTDPYVLVLNPDIEVRPGSIRRLEKVLDDRPRAGAVGGFAGNGYLPRRFPGPLQLIGENLGLFAPSKERAQFGEQVVPVQQTAGAVMLIRRSAFTGIGGMDADFWPAWYEDVDFCRRLRTAGWEIYFEPRARFGHAGGYSMKHLGYAAFAGFYYRNQLRYARKHFAAAWRLPVRASVLAGVAVRALWNGTPELLPRLVAGVFWKW